MSATKQVKELLEQVRARLDPDSRAMVEPLLRQILDVAKPKTITQIAYHSDPKDQAEIASLRAQMTAKDNEIRDLRFKLSSHRLRRGMPLNELLQTLHKRGFAFHECFRRCLDAASSDERARIEILKKALVAFHVNLGAYLKTLFPSDAIDGKKLTWIISDATLTALKQVAESIHAESGVNVDFKISMAKRT